MVKQKFTIMENELLNVMCLLKKPSILPKKSYYKNMEKHYAIKCITLPRQKLQSKKEKKGFIEMPTRFVGFCLVELSISASLFYVGRFTTYTQHS